MTTDRPLFFLALFVAVLAVLGTLFPTVREFIALRNHTDVVRFTLDHLWDDRALALFNCDYPLTCYVVDRR